MSELPRTQGSSRVAGDTPATRIHGRLGDPPAKAAGSILAQIGFLMVPGPPSETGPSYLLVALRPSPSRSHFDPERVDFWSAENDVPELTSVSWASPAPPSSRFLWGTIEMTDRVHATNRFVSFGGSFTLSRSDGVRVARFTSEAPILLLAEHAGPAQLMASCIAGFFAVLRAAVGESQQLLRQAVSLSPTALYAAYLELDLRRHPNAIAAGIEPSGLTSTQRSERERLRRTAARELLQGRELAVAVDELVWRKTS